MDFLALMRAVWEESLDGIVISDAHTVILDVNPAYCRLTGYTREQLIGQKTNVIRSGLTPRAVFNDMWENLHAKGKWVGELVNQHPDGTVWISFLSITRVVSAAGEIEAYVGIARDLTRHRELEDQLRLQTTRLMALLECISACVVMFDTDERCVVVNRELTKLLGCDEADLLGHTRAELVDRLGAFFQRREVLTTADATGSATLVSRAEPLRFFTAYWRPVLSTSGASLGWIFVCRDITRETEVDRMKSEFIATVSHELRTPMTSIKGALGLLLGGATGQVAPLQEELLTIAQSNIDRLIRLINDILDLSRMESGRYELRRLPIWINDTVQAAVRELEHVRTERRLEINLDLATDLPIMQADPDRIGQVLVNLLGNAYKFTETGGQVTVRTRFTGREVQVQVSDDGPGIARDQLEVIFERFQRAPGAATRKVGGTGLGLSIAKAIVEEHGGRIWADSATGHGATFTFVLPLA